MMLFAAARCRRRDTLLFCSVLSAVNCDLPLTQTHARARIGEHALPVHKQASQACPHAFRSRAFYAQTRMLLLQESRFINGYLVALVGMRDRVPDVVFLFSLGCRWAV